MLLKVHPQIHIRKLSDRQPHLRKRLLLPDCEFTVTKILSIVHSFYLGSNSGKSALGLRLLSSTSQIPKKATCV